MVVIVHLTHGDGLRIFGPFDSDEQAMVSGKTRYLRSTRHVKIVKLG